MEIEKGDWVWGVVNLDNEKIPAIVDNPNPIIRGSKEKQVLVFSFEKEMIIDTNEEIKYLKKINPKLAWLLLGENNFALLKERVR